MEAKSEYISQAIELYYLRFMIRMGDNITLFKNADVIEEKMEQLDDLIATLTPGDENLSKDELKKIYSLANSILLSSIKLNEQIQITVVTYKYMIIRDANKEAYDKNMDLIKKNVQINLKNKKQDIAMMYYKAAQMLHGLQINVDKDMEEYESYKKKEAEHEMFEIKLPASFKKKIERLDS